MDKINFIVKDSNKTDFSIEAKGSIKVYPPLSDIEITPNKETQIFKNSEKYGYDQVTVNPIPENYIDPNGSLTIKENGIKNVREYQNVIVDIPIPKPEIVIPDGYIKPEGSIDITENGSVDVTSIKTANVNVEPNLQERELIIINKGTGEVVAEEGYDGLSKVIFHVQTGGSDGDGGNYAPRFISFTGYTGSELDEELSKLDTSKMTTMAKMFQSCSKLTSLDLSNFDTSNVTNMSYMFGACSVLPSIDLSTVNTSNVTNMKYMFQNCKALTSLNIENLNTENVTDMSYMFTGCSALRTLDLSSLNTSNVTTMSNMFSNSGFTSLDLNGWDVSSLKGINSMFYNSPVIEEIKLTNWNPTNLTEAQYTFNACRQLKKVDMSGFNCSKVTNLSRMFYDCTALNDVKLGTFTGVTNTNGMFYKCTSLTKLDLSGFDGSQITDSGNMFYGCTNLSTLIINNPNVLKITNINAFSGTPIYRKTGKVYVPDDLVDSYKSATSWSTYASVIKPISEMPTE